LQVLVILAQLYLGSNDLFLKLTYYCCRFLILACPEETLPEKPEAGQLASAVHQEVSTAPFLAKFIVFAKRTSFEEGQLKVYCSVIDDDDIGKLNDDDDFEEVARSGDVEVFFCFLQP
jgi:ankyrin